eukprot:2239083-Pyramimonas_sp.AAC.1
MSAALLPPVGTLITYALILIAGGASRQRQIRVKGDVLQPLIREVILVLQPLIELLARRCDIDGPGCCCCCCH